MESVLSVLSHYRDLFVEYFCVLFRAMNNTVSRNIRLSSPGYWKAYPWDMRRSLL